MVFRSPCLFLEWK